MSIYKVDTESIIALSRLLHVGANAVDQTMRQSAAPALRKIVFQRGADVFATAQRLADALRRMNTLKNDLNIMGDALKVVAEEAYNSDGSVFALFQGIPVCVATNQQIVQFDYTAMFLDNRNPKVDALLIGWASNWIENMKGVVANGLNKLGVKVALWDTIPEEMIRDSIDSLLEQLEKDSIEGGYDNSKFDEAYGMYRKFLSLGIEIEDTSIQELMGRSTDEFTENEYLQLLVKKENLSFMKEISDQLDAGLRNMTRLNTQLAWPMKSSRSWPETILPAQKTCWQSSRRFWTRAMTMRPLIGRSMKCCVNTRTAIFAQSRWHCQRSRIKASIRRWARLDC